jgi:hypothetical protein
MDPILAFAKNSGALTAFLRALVLFHDAEDYSRSNTLHGYAEAGRLYDASARLFDPCLGPLPVSRLRREQLDTRTLEQAYGGGGETTLPAENDVGTVVLLLRQRHLLQSQNRAGHLRVDPRSFHKGRYTSGPASTPSASVF